MNNDQNESQVKRKEDAPPNVAEKIVSAFINNE